MESAMGDKIVYDRVQAIKSMSMIVIKFCHKVYCIRNVHRERNKVGSNKSEKDINFLYGK